jgi:hypothetical protein
MAGMSNDMSASMAEEDSKDPVVSATARRCPMHPQIATSAQPAQMDAPEFSAPQPPVEALLGTASFETFVSELHFDNSERGPPASR